MATKEYAKAQYRKKIKLANKGKASLIGLQISASKVRIILNVIRNKPVNMALNYLTFQRKSAAKPLKKLLDSAIANAVINGHNADKLIIHKIFADKGAFNKKFITRAQGKSNKIRKQTSNIKVYLIEQKK